MDIGCRVMEYDVVGDSTGLGGGPRGRGARSHRWAAAAARARANDDHRLTLVIVAHRQSLAIGGDSSRRDLPSFRKTFSTHLDYGRQRPAATRRPARGRADALGRP